MIMTCVCLGVKLFQGLVASTLFMSESLALEFWRGIFQCDPT